ncbi:MAG TPA: c-type cytochrome [Candidatus Sulfotelmatobacter sp.]|jgi:mono/diheme cytochrome c family protein|nr:c-type cytochrome [Candidatus Sulfotelmatobacter sp.]
MKTSKSLPVGIAAGIAAFFLVGMGTGCRKAATVTAADLPASVLEMETIPRTAVRLARGQYLVEGLLQCPFCHSDYNFAQRPAVPVEGKKDGGLDLGDEGLPKGNRIIAPNISSDPDYGAGKWKDADFVRALRRGIGHDGRTLFPIMPYPYFRNLSDEDLASVIVYERSMAPVHIEQPKTTLTDDIKKTLQLLEPLAHVPEPDRSDRLAYGKYLVTAGHCDACHTPQDEHGNPIPGMDFAGGVDLSGPWGADPKKIISVASLNLTPDPSGISYFDEQMFIIVIRTGQVNARPLASIMPWGFFRNLSDADLKAIFAYLRTLKPVKHRVDNTETARYCKICRGKHGFGERN